MYGAGLPLLLLTISSVPAAPASPGSVHAAHMAHRLGEQVPGPRAIDLPAPTPGPHVRVYGYQAYWNADLQAVPWDELSHLALFNAGVTTSGGLTNTARWSDADEAVAIAADYGVRVHLCVTNFVPAELTAILSSASARTTLIDNLRTWVDSTGAHGVNIDFEGLPSSQRANMVTFTEQLAAEFDEIVLATPAVDWSNAWDLQALTEHADLFIMGYGYHWSGSDYAGPVDPLYGGDPWASLSLSKSIDTYASRDADMSRIILGLPLYGYTWPTNTGAYPAEATGTGTSIAWTAAHTKAAEHGRQFDTASRTPMYYDGARQGWYSDLQSVQERTRYAVDAEIGGIGFWALHYDGGDPALWSMIRAETTLEDIDTGGPDDTGLDDTGDSGDPAPPPGDYVADAGVAQLAYKGDIVLLSAEASRGPEPLAYQWTQVGGRSVDLSDATSAAPTFKARKPGNLTFQVVVGDGVQWSAPATSRVTVLQPGVGYGCDQGAPVFWAWWVPMVVVARRRRP